MEYHSELYVTVLDGLFNYIHTPPTLLNNPNVLGFTKDPTSVM